MLGVAFAPLSLLPLDTSAAPRSSARSRQVFQQLCSQQAMDAYKSNATVTLPTRVSTALSVLARKVKNAQTFVLEEERMTTPRVRKQARCFSALLETLAANPAGEPATVCETGFNGAGTFGYISLALSTTVYLSALPLRSRYIAFDIGAKKQHTADGVPAKKVMADPLLAAAQRMKLAAGLLNSSMFPGQLELVYGRSSSTLRPYLDAHPNLMCDLISFDGEHTVAGALADWALLQPHARKGALIFVDDAKAAGRSGFDRSKESAWSQMLKSRLVRPVGCKYQVPSNPGAGSGRRGMLSSICR